MAQEEKATGERLEALERRVKVLEENVGTMYRELAEFRNAGGGLGMPGLFGGGGGGSRPSNLEPISEEAISWAGRASILPRVATFSFLLVIALILRTLADSGVVDKFIGAIAGTVYAVALLIVAWFLYAKKNPQALVFSITGAILLSTIVVETHSRFMTLPLVPAYLMLIAMGALLAVTSRKYNESIPVSAGVIGMCIAGAAMDFPTPSWPLLALVFLSATLLASYASSIKSSSWLRWLVALVTMAMTALWALNLAAALGQGGSLAPGLSASWFGPALAILFATFLALTVSGLVRGFSSRLTLFDLALPPLNAVWAFGAAAIVLGAAKVDPLLITALGAGLAIVQFLIALSLAAKGKDQTAPATSLSLAALATFFMSLPHEPHAFTAGLAVVALASLVLVFVSKAWASDGTRLAAYAGQFAASFALAIAILGRYHSTLRTWEMLPALVVATAAIVQFAWSRKNPPSGSSWFASTDRRDKMAIAVLVGGLSSLFMAGRIGLESLFLPLLASDQPAFFDCGQSVLINVAAIAVVLIASVRRNKELRNVALLIVIAGALKVFMVDLLNYHGLPLVASVLTFGVAALVFSVALGTWTREAGEGSDSSGSATS